MNLDRIVVGTVGRVSVGKTHLINKLTETNLASGNDVNTEGASIKYTKLTNSGKLTNNINNTSTLLEIVDTSGSDVAYNMDDVDRYKMELLTMDLLRKFTLSYCKVLLFLTNYMTISEMKYIKSCIKNPETKNIFIIHNFLNVFEESEIESLIKRQILDHFDVEEIITNDGVLYLQKYGNKKEICHFVLAKEGSSAGSKYNHFTFIYLREKILNLTEKSKDFSYNAFNYFKDSMNNYLNLFISKKLDPEDKRVEIKDKILFTTKKDLIPSYFSKIKENAIGLLNTELEADYICYFEKKNMYIDIFNHKSNDYLKEYDIKSEYLNRILRLQFTKKSKKSDSFVEFVKDQKYEIIETEKDEVNTIEIEIPPTIATYLVDNNGIPKRLDDYAIRFTYNLSKEIELVEDYKKFLQNVPKGEQKDINSGQIDNKNQFSTNYKIKFNYFKCKSFEEFIKQEAYLHLNNPKDYDDKIENLKPSKFVMVVMEPGTKIHELLNLLSDSSEVDEFPDIHDGFSYLNFYKNEKNGITYIFTSGLSDLIIHNKTGNNKDSLTLLAVFESLMTHLCCAIMFITNNMRHSQVLKCKNLYSKIKASKKPLIIIHCFESFNDKNRLDLKIKDSIIEPFDAEEKEIVLDGKDFSGKFKKYYVSKKDNNIMLFVVLRNSKKKEFEDVYNTVAAAKINSIIKLSFNFMKINYKGIIRQMFIANGMEEYIKDDDSIKYDSIESTISLKNKYNTEFDLNYEIASYYPELLIYEKNSFNQREVLVAFKSWCQYKSEDDDKGKPDSKRVNKQIDMDIKTDRDGKALLYITGIKLRNPVYKLILCSEFKYGKIQITTDFTHYGNYTYHEDEVQEKDGYFFKIFKFNA